MLVCRTIAAPQFQYLPTVQGAAYTDRWTVECAGGLEGASITIDGLSSTLTDVLVRIDRLDGSSQTELLAPKSPSFKVEASAGRIGVAKSYLRLGVEHILLGIDHLLFVLALLILVEGARRLIWTVTAFTAAHSLTLGGSDPWFCQRAAATGRSGHRVEHRFCRGRNCPFRDKDDRD